MVFKRKISFSDLHPVEDAEGNRHCRWCNAIVRYPRKAWCSDHCLHEYKIRAHTSYARKHVSLRDRGVCTWCHLDTTTARRALKYIYQNDREYWENCLLVLGKSCRFRTSLWEMDHILPVYKGGGACGLDNLQTLCRWCHRLKTNQESPYPNKDKDFSKKTLLERRYIHALTYEYERIISHGKNKGKKKKR